MNNLPWITKMDLIGIAFALGFAIVAVAIWVVETWRNRRKPRYLHLASGTRIKLVDTGEPPYEGLDVPFYNEDGEWVVPDGKGGYTPAQAGTTEGEER